MPRVKHSRVDPVIPSPEIKHRTRRIPISGRLEVSALEAVSGNDGAASRSMPGIRATMLGDAKTRICGSAGGTNERNRKDWRGTIFTIFIIIISNTNAIAGAKAAGNRTYRSHDHKGRRVAVHVVEASHPGRDLSVWRACLGAWVVFWVINGTRHHRCIQSRAVTIARSPQH